MYCNYANGRTSPDEHRPLNYCQSSVQYLRHFCVKSTPVSPFSIQCRKIIKVDLWLAWPKLKVSFESKYTEEYVSHMGINLDLMPATAILRFSFLTKNPCCALTLNSLE